MKKDNKITFLLIPHSEGESKSIKIPAKLFKALNIFLILGIVISSFYIYDYVQLGKENQLLDIVNTEDSEKIAYYSESYLELFHNVENFKEKILEIDNLENYTRVDNEFESTELFLSEDINNLTISANHKSKITASALDLNQTINDIEVINKVIGEQETSLNDLISLIDNKNKKIASLPSIWPVVGIITSPFGYRKDPFNGRLSYHDGIDIANKFGTPIYATADGTVTFSGWNSGGYGNEVKIDHGNGFVTYYGHNAKNLVKVGDKVKKGQIIADMGSTGRSTGPHVDYRISINGKKVNPLNYIND